MKMTILGSSSKGNCYVLQNDSEALIIEAGMSLAEVKKALGWDIAKVKVCIISHQHNDHAGHAAEYEKAGIPLLALPSVIEAKNLEATTTTSIKDGCGYIYGGFRILPFKVKHDVPCVGYLIEHQETGRILFFTDTYAMPYDFPNITHFMAEANYSDEILDHNVLEGYIPAALRRRVITSHMSIDNTIGILKRHDLTKTKDILLIHLSDGNSNEKEFITKVRRATGKTTRAASPGMELDFDKGFIDI